MLYLTDILGIEMTKKQIEKEIAERVKNGSIFSKSELRREYTRIHCNRNSGKYRQHNNSKYTYDITINNPNSKLNNIIKQIKNGKRFEQRDVIWLQSKGYLHSKSKLGIEYNSREAKFYLQQFSQKNNLWHLVNASSHLRKANNSQKAIQLINNVNFNKINNKSLKSALLITQGGAYKDIHQFDEALKNAQKGYSFNPTSFHPCTLFGAVYYELGRLDMGNKWFQKAIDNGANTDGVDSEIKSIYKRAKGKNKIELKKHLLKIDSYRYGWVDNKC